MTSGSGPVLICWLEEADSPEDGPTQRQGRFRRQRPAKCTQSFVRSFFSDYSLIRSFIGSHDQDRHFPGTWWNRLPSKQTLASSCRDRSSSSDARGQSGVRAGRAPWAASTCSSAVMAAEAMSARRGAAYGSWRFEPSSPHFRGRGGGLLPTSTPEGSPAPPGPIAVQGAYGGFSRGSFVPGRSKRHFLAHSSRDILAGAPRILGTRLKSPGSIMKNGKPAHANTTKATRRLESYSCSCSCSSSSSQSYSSSYSFSCVRAAG